MADSDYGSEENYSFMDKRGIETYVKYNRFHIEHRAHYTPDPFSQEALYYDKQHDYYVCPMGQHMTRVGTKYKKTESSYVSEKVVYSAQRCERCKLRSQCRTAKGNRSQAPAGGIQKKKLPKGLPQKKA